MKTTARVLAAAFVAATAFAPAAFAGERVSDAQYLTGARCLGVARAANTDTSAVDAFLKEQRIGRDPYVQDQADNARRDAARAYKAGGSKRAAVTGDCDRFATRLAARSTSTAR